MAEHEMRSRQYKVMIWNPDKMRREWIVLNRQVKYTIKNEATLYSTLDQVSEKYTILRVFQTASLFSDPQNLQGHASNNNRLMRSYMSLESDKDINYNLRLAAYLHGELIDRGITPLIVYTGAKSIHQIFEFNYLKFLGTKYLKIINTQKPMSFDKRIWLEKLDRFNFLHRILPEELPEKGFDYVTAMDPFRVVPVVSTMNLLSHRMVVELEPGDLLATRELILAKSVI